MNASTLVSVIVATHSRPDFLRKTIKSILSQTYSNLELIVVSDGFSEINKVVIDEFSDARLNYREQENSGGPASPRNHGIRVAKGDYIAFCDDDDLWTPDKIEKQVKVLSSSPAVGFCYTNMIRFDEKKEWVGNMDNGKADFDSLLYVNTIPVSSIMIKKTLLDLYGDFVESSIVGYSEDYDFVIRYAYYTQLYHIDEYLVKYWSGENRTTYTDNSYKISCHLKYFKGILGCYYINYREKRIKTLKVISAIFYQLKLLTKVIVYNLLKNIRGK